MTPRRLHVPLSQADYAAGLAIVSADLTRDDTSRRRMLFARLGVTIFTMLAVVVVFPGGLPALLFACLLFWIGESIVQASFQTSAFGISFDPQIHGDTHVLFDEARITEEGGARTRHWTWATLRRVTVTDALIILRFAGWDMIVLPTASWASPAERAAFLSELRASAQDAEHCAAAKSAMDSEASIRLTEPVLIARLALAAAGYALVFEGSFGIAFSPRPGAILLWLAAGMVAGGLMWLASGWAFRRLARRSAAAALWAAWSTFAVVALLFAISFLG